MSQRAGLLGGPHRHATGRHLYPWLVLVAAAALVLLCTDWLNGSIAVRLIGSPLERTTPYPEVAAILIGLVGCAMIAPRLATWEATASRRLWPYAVAESLLVLAASAALVVLLPLGIAENTSPALTRGEWQAYALQALRPYAMSTVTFVSLGLILIRRLGARVGLLAAIGAVMAVWLVQTTRFGSTWLPVAGGARTVHPVAVTATAAAVATIAIWLWARGSTTRALTD